MDENIEQLSAQVAEERTLLEFYEALEKSGRLTERAQREMEELQESLQDNLLLIEDTLSTVAMIKGQITYMDNLNSGIRQYDEEFIFANEWGSEEESDGGDSGTPPA